MRQYPKTQLKTLVIALRQIFQLGTGIILVSSALCVHAQSMPDDNDVDYSVNPNYTDSPFPSLQKPVVRKPSSAAQNIPSTNDLNSSLSPGLKPLLLDQTNIDQRAASTNAQSTSLSSAPLDLSATPLDLDITQLAPLDMAALIQQAETAKQNAASDAARVTAPSKTDNVSQQVEQSTREELITSSITSGLGAPEQPDVVVREVDPIDEQAIADAELQQAKETTQVLADSADVNQNQQPDEIIADNAEALKTDSATAASTASSEKKPNLFKRVWYKFWPPKGELAAALPTIDVVVVGASDVQADNIRARLEQYTVEAFTDFRASLPQLRSLARDASEAVGFYNSEFRFEQVSADKLRVRVTPHEPVMVRSETIDYQGEANGDVHFLEVKNEPDLKVGDQMHDGLYENIKTRITNTATEKGYFDGYWIMHDVKVTLPDNTADISLDYDSGERYKLGEVIFKNANPDKPIPLKEEILRQLVPFEENDEYGSWKVTNLSRNFSDTRYFNNVQVDVIIPDPISKPIQLPPDADVEQLTALQRQALAIKNEGSAADNDSDKRISATSGVDESQFAGVGQDADSPLQRSAEAKENLTEAQIKEAERIAAAEKVRETKIIPVTVTVNAEEPNSAEVGIGYGTDTEFRLRGQYRKALINSSGHSVEANLELSKIRQALDGRYSLPYKHPLEDTVSIFGGYESEKRRDNGTDLGLQIDTATVGVERAIKPKGSVWQHTITARYRLDELIRNNNGINKALLPPPFNLKNSKFEQESLLFGYGMNKTKTVGRLDPTQAFRQFYQVEVGTKSLLTDTDMAIIRAGWRIIHSFGENDDHQVVGRADAATILTENFEEVPYNLRFFAGGDQSIRGYDYKSLSTEQNGYLVGGQNLAVGSLEYNYRFKPKWRGAVFVDAGNAFDKEFNDPVKVGAGVGVRWSSPVGPIRVDVAAGVSEKDLPIRLHFFIGPQL